MLIDFFSFYFRWKFKVKICTIFWEGKIINEMSAPDGAFLFIILVMPFSVQHFCSSSVAKLSLKTSHHLTSPHLKSSFKIWYKRKTIKFHITLLNRFLNGILKINSLLLFLRKKWNFLCGLTIQNIFFVSTWWILNNTLFYKCFFPCSQGNTTKHRTSKEVIEVSGLYFALKITWIFGFHSKSIGN